MARNRWPDRADEQRRAAIDNIAVARARLAEITPDIKHSDVVRTAVAEAKEYLADAERYLVLARYPDTR